MQVDPFPLGDRKQVTSRFERKLHVAIVLLR